MKRKIDFTIKNDIFVKYPHTQIGYVVAKLDVQKTHPHVEKLKQGLGTVTKNANITMEHPRIKSWREAFKSFEVSTKKYNSSLESLLKRVVKNQGIWNISSAVDLYNCCSVTSMFPMGGYDLDKIEGTINLRFGKEGETFRPLKTDKEENVQSKHVVYTDSDDSRVICWLWNYKDSRETSISEETKYAIFFIDSAFALNDNAMTMQEAITFLENNLLQIGATPICSGISSAESPSFNYTLPTEDEILTIQQEKQKQFEIACMNKAPSEVSDKKVRTQVLPEFFKPVLQSEETFIKECNIIGCAAQGEYDNVEKLLKHNLDTAKNKKDWFDNSALHHAARGGHIKVIGLLLDFGFDANLKNNNQETPLQIAHRNKLTEVIEFMKSRGIVDNSKSEISVLEDPDNSSMNTCRS